MILCDGCDQGWHVTCITPPLAEIPEDEWFCAVCAGSRAAAHGNAAHEPSARAAASTPAKAAGSAEGGAKTRAAARPQEATDVAELAARGSGAGRGRDDERASAGWEEEERAEETKEEERAETPPLSLEATHGSGASARAQGIFGRPGAAHARVGSAGSREMGAEMMSKGGLPLLALDARRISCIDGDSPGRRGAGGGGRAGGAESEVLGEGEGRGGGRRPVRQRISRVLVNIAELGGKVMGGLDRLHKAAAASSTMLFSSPSALPASAADADAASPTAAVDAGGESSGGGEAGGAPIGVEGPHVLQITEG